MATLDSENDDELPSDDGSSDSDEFLRAVARAPSVAPRPPMASEPNLERIAHFRIHEKIGRGGMGIVYRAHDEKLNRVVALKLLPEDFANDAPRRRRFMREAQLAAAITHSNVATVHEIGETDGRVYIAMELVQGVTLRKRLENGALPIAEAVALAKAMARGMAKAHTRGIAHRDLKPDNVMVGDDGTVKILDFGLAKPMETVPREAQDEPATLTQEGRIMGTPGYMSPEQATGRPLDVRTDVFSLGVILYEMVTGARPFAGETPMDIVIATSRDTPIPVAKRNPKVPEDLARVIERCLKKESSERFANADELLAALEALRATTAHRTPRRSAAIAAAVAAIVGVGAFGASRLAASTPASMPASTAIAAPPTATPTPTSATASGGSLARPSASEATSTPTSPEPSPSPTPSVRPAPVRSVAARSPVVAVPRPSTSTAPPSAPSASAMSPGGVIQRSPY